MAWTSPKTWTAGLVLTAAELNQHLRDNLKAIGDPWTAYTPTWTSTGTAPAVGNGSIAGAYMQAGKLVHFQLKLVMGSTTTYGTGTYLFSLPVLPKVTLSSESLNIQGLVWDASALARSFRSGYLGATGAIVLASESGTPVSGTVPYALTTNDAISISGSYEAA